MNNTYGNHLTMTIWGESHGPKVGILLDGLTPGLPVDRKRIAEELTRRRPEKNMDTARVEEDDFTIESGVFSGKTTGTPLLIAIPNRNTASSDYVYGPARPSHADYTGFVKYHGYEDYRGGGHFSGRITAGIVAMGGILLPALEKKGIRIQTRIQSIGGFESEEEMDRAVLSAKEKGDSLGGILKTTVSGVPAGLGNPWFDSVESALSHLLFSVGGVKGVEFGLGFDFADCYGSSVRDELTMEDGQIRTKTNYNGGINGGITNGMDILFRTAVKPTPSVYGKCETVDFLKQEETTMEVTGRHDPAFVRRLPPVIDALTAFQVADFLLGRYGEDALL